MVTAFILPANVCCIFNIWTNIYRMDVQDITDQRSFPVPCNIDKQLNIHSPVRHLASSHYSINEKPEKLKYISKHLKSHISRRFCLFATKFWEGGRELQMTFCLSVSRASTLMSGGNTNLNLYPNLCALFAHRGGRDAKTLLLCSHALSCPSHLMKLSLLNVLFCNSVFII